MRRKMQNFSVIVLLGTLCSHQLCYNKCNAIEIDNLSSRTGALLEETLASLEAIMYFLENHLEGGNLDLFAGTRLAEGQLVTLQQHIRGKVRVSSAIKTRLNSLRAQLSSISERGITFVEELSPEYYQHAGGILRKGILIGDYNLLRKINKNLITPNVGKETLIGPKMDVCIHNVLPSVRSIASECVLSEPCWKLVTSPASYGYSLTHQLIVLLLAEKTGCREALRYHANKSNTTVLRVIDQMCANIYDQADQISRANFPPRLHDLFMEQITFCGSLGYSDFFKRTWLRQILRWQRKIGCFGDRRIPKFPSTELIPRADREMTDGCSAHETGMAAAALATYTKFLLLFAKQID